VHKINTIFIFLAVFIGSCVDPLDIEIEEDLNVLIVEGSITTGPGPHNIRLSSSAKYASIIESFVRPVQRAKVVIRDSDGNNFQLIEGELPIGVYTTPSNFLAVVGKSYTLQIRTANGLEYTSLPETIIGATNILGLTAQFRKIAQTVDNFVTGFDVYAQIQDSPEAQNFYMWKNDGTYQTTTFPENFTMAIEVGGPQLPAPKDCCRTCWVSELSADKSLQLLSDNNANGDLITDQVAFIEDDGLRFGDKYRVRIEQHSLTLEAFQFFSLLKEQTSIDGDIFDPPPATLRGNMINLTNPDENVIGYFRASDVKIDSMFIFKEMLPEPSPLNFINDDCRQYKAGTTDEPSYW